MNKTLKNVLIVLGAILLLVGMGVALFFSDRIPMNSADTVGNTAGNLNNEGLFCESDGTVYFSNTSAGGVLCAMDPDETNVRQINSLKVRNILAGGKFLYFYQTDAVSDNLFAQFQGKKSFNRCDLKGNNMTVLTRDVVVTGQLAGNYLYLLTSAPSKISFYKLKIDKSEQVDLADYNINPACVSNGLLYYNGTQQDHYLYALNTANDVVSEVWRGNLWYPVAEGDFIYYLDVEGNYRLCRYSLSRNEIQILTQDRVDCFNVGSGYIYYQKNGNEPELRCMRTDGSDNFALAKGNYTHINMTSRYVYFQPYGDETTTYHSPLGSGDYSSFVP
ncbi:MAG: DUF5050 domain-containing protein [Roseburia sp.]|nr:DUF5050 domain-containing protein [Roseburia sp.]MCM1099005.1 DUF5050 domain-containing protein [Ruminococcus flavefaciens]